MIDFLFVLLQRWKRSETDSTAINLYISHILCTLASGRTQLASAKLLLSSLPLSLSRDPYVGSPLLSPCLSSETCYSDLYSCSPPLFPSLLFERSLCRFFTLCLPFCLQRPVTQISVLALLLSSPLSLSRDPYVGSLLSVSPSVFRDLLLRSLFLLSSLPLSLSFERSLCRFSSLCLPFCLQRPVNQVSALPLFLSSPLSLFQDFPM